MHGLLHRHWHLSYFLVVVAVGTEVSVAVMWLVPAGENSYFAPESPESHSRR